MGGFRARIGASRAAHCLQYTSLESRMLESILKDPQLLEVDRIDVEATPEVVWERLRHGDLMATPAVRALFAVRGLPAQLRGERPARALRLDDLQSSPERPGFSVLADDPPREIVVGAVGKVWKPDIPFAHVGSARDFTAFAEPGYIKVAWAIRVVPAEEKGSRVELEVRVKGTDEAAWRRFQRYFLVIGPGSRYIRKTLLGTIKRSSERQIGSPTQTHAVADGLRGAALIAANLATPFLRGLRSHWGLDGSQAARSLPGDELVPDPAWSYTHGVEIEAPAAAVWPWVAQVGADRAGFYSYEWLENLLGCRLENADRVNEDWQMKPNDQLLLHPDAPPLRVERFESGHHFVAFAPGDERARAKGEPWCSVSWLFLVEPLGPQRCRFISRYRANYSHHFAVRLGFGPTLIEPVSFVMDRRMLLGVKERAEGGASCA